MVMIPSDEKDCIYPSSEVQMEKKKKKKKESLHEISNLIVSFRRVKTSVNYQV